MSLLIRNLPGNETLHTVRLEKPVEALQVLMRMPLRAEAEAGGFQLQAIRFGEVLLLSAAVTSPEIKLELVFEEPLLFAAWNIDSTMQLQDETGTPRHFSRLSSNLFSGEKLKLSADFRGERNDFLLAFFTPPAFAALAGGLGDSLLPQPGSWCMEENCPLGLSAFAALNAIADCQLEGAIGKAFLSAKCSELLALLAASIEQQQKQQFVYCKTAYDFERISFARDYLLQHYDVPPTLNELSLIAGMNEFKLKNAFREVYGNTVFAYLTDYKMELAKRELAAGAKTASELAYDLGYSSLQHFSKVFKKKFGFPPAAFKS